MEETPKPLPIDHLGPFDPPDVLNELQAKGPLMPMIYPDGHVGWLAVTYNAVREVLADLRFSGRLDLLRPPIDIGISLLGIPAEPGQFLRMDPPEHTRYRRLLTAQFTARRIKQLESRIIEVTQERLDAMERSGPPVDLLKEYAQPITARVICELLGIPHEDRGESQRHMVTVLNLDASQEERAKAQEALTGLFGPLIAAKRKTPTDDFYSNLVNLGELTDQELSNIGFLLFGGGLDTTATMIGLSVFTLLQHPDQLELLRSDPDIVEGAVEELLRYLNTVVPGPARTALEDVEVEGQLVRKGQTVTVSFRGANRDPTRFDNPEVLDVTRSAQGHVSFGHGVHHCLGRPLALLEMQIALPALFERFPDLRLDVPAKDVPLRDRSTVYGLQRLPVAW